MTDYDVIIIGAGPAGSSCAKYLTNNGVKVLIIEQKKLPRFKCCSGLYSTRGLNFIKDLFGEIPEEIFCSNNEVIGNVSKNGDRFFSIPQLRFKNAFRDKMDYWMVKNSGADIIDHNMFISYEYINNIFTVRVKNDDGYSYYKSKYLVGADGARSRLRRKLDKNYSLGNSGFAYQKVYTGNFGDIKSNMYNVIVSKEYTDYVASFHIKGDYLFVATSSPLFSDKLETLINTNFKTELKEIRTESTYSEFYKSKDNLFFGDENLLLVGESTGMISVFSEGIPTAVISGIEAAKSIISGKENIFEEYKNNIQNEIEFIEKAWSSAKIFF